MFYVYGLNWEAFYRPDGYRPTQREFATETEAQAYCNQMATEHPEACWSVSQRSLYDSGAPWENEGGQ